MNAGVGDDSGALAGLSTCGAMIRAARRARGLTLEALAERVGCAKSALSMLERGRRTSSRAMLIRLEDALGLARGELVRADHWEHAPGEVKSDVARLQAAQRAARVLAGKQLAELGGLGGLDRALASGQLRRIISQIDPELNAQSELGVKRAAAGAIGNDSRAGETGVGASAEAGIVVGGDAEGGAVVRLGLPVEVPLMNKVAAGYPTEFTDLGYPARVADEYVRVPEVSDPDAFGARVVGDSMEPEYREGDMVVFSPRAAVYNGSDCFVRLERDSQTTFKRVYFEDEAGRVIDDAALRGEGGTAALRVVRIRLQPLNPRYGPRVYEREEVAGLYAAVTVTRKVGGTATRA
ncbi:MAG: helix-turn-helix domain-containing protein [Phycisphaerales bacterium]|nr:helix-turn-helix domain-containing protein [Phycisphaerales bacterium]